MSASTQNDLEAQLAEAKVRIAALEAALAAKEKRDPVTECCGYSCEEMAEQLAETLGKSKDAVLEAIYRAPQDLALQYFYDDSEWDCSCVTPEMCRGDCCCETSEMFHAWLTEQRAKGIKHRYPVRAFNAANKGLWGIDYRIRDAEEHWAMARRRYKDALLKDSDGPDRDEKLSAFSDDVDAIEAELERLGKLRQELLAASAAGAPAE